MSDGRVLVVDDSLSVRRAIERMLAPRGLTVTGATDGAEAVERLAEERPALVICDVMLPEVDGYEVCRHVRGEPALAGVPVLLISGVSSPEVEERAAAAGAVGVLSKPFTAESLIARIEELVGPGPGPGREEDRVIDEVLTRARRLPGYQAAWALDPERGGGRDAAGKAPPPELLAMARHLAGAAGELGLGDPHELFVAGEEKILVVRRIGRAAIAVCFESPVRLGLARHLVRLLVRRAESLHSLPEGDRNGNHPG